FGLEGRVAVGEIALDRVLATGRTGLAYRGVPRFPSSPFDVAVGVPRRTPAAEVARVLGKGAGAAGRAGGRFDVYERTRIRQGQRSLALTVTFGDDEATLKPAALEKLQSRAIESLRRAGWMVRTGETPST